ncbi:MAG TPA: L-dopachrome tautomerase-related protein [Opitutales bacterium]|nr:L-dopachrome tautomerase-related protein [Opitutales bacterium]
MKIYLSIIALQGLLFVALANAKIEPRVSDLPGPLDWEIVAKLDQAPGNLTVTPDGRILLSLHQHFSPDLRMGELDPTDTTRIIPFPNEAMAFDRSDAPLALNSVLGVQTDRSGVVWMLDNTMRNGGVPKLVGWKVDSAGGHLHQVIYLPPPAVKESPFLNDLAVDSARNVIYIADTSRAGQPALIVVDTKTGLARRVLENHESVSPEEIPMIAAGEQVAIRRPDGSTFNPKVAVNPIALDASGEYLYYGPMTGTRLYRIPTSVLRDSSLSDAERAAAVEFWAERPISDGISIDQAGNIYISAVGANEIGVIQIDTRAYQSLIRSETIAWPDAFSFGPDGYMYAVINQLHKGPVLNAGEDVSQAPYLIIRFKPLAPGVIGR